MHKSAVDLSLHGPDYEEIDGAYWFGPLCEDMHKSLDEFEFWPDLRTDYGVSSCIRASVTLCIRSRMVRDRILKFDMWN